MTGLNTKQRMVLLIGAVLFVAMGIYVPWRADGSSVLAEQGLRPPLLSFQEKNPVPVASAEYHHALDYGFIFRPQSQDQSCNIDLSRLAVEWVSLVVLTGSLIVILAKKESGEYEH